MNKKLIVTIQQGDKSSVYGVITPEIIHYVCEQTGLNEKEFLSSLNQLEAMGIINTELATLH